MTSDAPLRYTLRWVDADGTTGERELHDGDLTIGRSSSCEVVLADSMVSREHARLHVKGDAVAIEDLNSRNGAFVNGEKVNFSDLRGGDEISLGSVTIHLIPAGGQETLVAEYSPEATVVLEREEPAPSPAQRQEAVVSEEMLRRPVLSESELAASGVDVQVAEYAALGGGVGSFVFVDFLRNAGVPKEEIIAVGSEEQPHSRYERLTRYSQIPRHERLRSNSDSCPDNVWGFPGYAVREAWHALLRGNLVGVAGPLWGIFGEPAISQTYTPRAGAVFVSVEREVERIGWKDMLRLGRIRAIRKSEEGRLVAIVSQSDAHRRKHVAVSARFLHMAVGYPAIRLLPDLAEYRERYREFERVVNAYEEHSQIYEQLRARGGTVLLRGRGIVASRIIQRLWEERAHNDKIVVVHLHRSRLSKGNNYGLARRAVQDQFEFQPFNWPKACWSGELRDRLQRGTPEQRAQLLAAWGGTTTADRNDWKQMVAQGLREGWYRTEYGAVRDVKPGDDGRVITSITSTLAGGGVLDLNADFVIDCTGLVASPERSPLLADLIETYGLPQDEKGRIRFSNEFEIEGLRHGSARAYSAGTITLGGGPYAPVDSFLGLQYAGLRAMDAIYRQRARGLRRLNGLYSFLQWTKWARGVAP